jgi:hypothetical protein
MIPRAQKGREDQDEKSVKKKPIAGEEHLGNTIDVYA